jgi:hypothetical protein
MPWIFTEMRQWSVLFVEIGVLIWLAGGAQRITAQADTVIRLVRRIQRGDNSTLF